MLLRKFFYNLELENIEILTVLDLFHKLKNFQPLIIKFGCDPTSTELHLGHLVILKKLLIFQEIGHRIHFLLGDFTSCIGDPSGINITRPLISYFHILKNMRLYRSQLFSILKKEFTIFHYNSIWLSQLGFLDFIFLTSICSFSRILERDDFYKRYITKKSIRVHEFLYPIFQGYDSAILCSDIEFGGSDQQFNFLLSREIQRKTTFYCNQIAIMSQLLVGLDGLKKMSKSLNNYIAFSSSPFLFFCKIMNLSDSFLWNYYFLFNFKLLVELSIFKINIIFFCINPKKLKIDLAKLLITCFYSYNQFFLSYLNFFKFFIKKNFFFNVKHFFIYLTHPIKFILAVLRLYLFSVVSSTNKFNLIYRYGGVKINNLLLKNFNFLVKQNNCFIVWIGKKIKFRVYIYFN